MGMATFVLLHGASSDAWYWHLVAPELEAAGHAVVAVDLPIDDNRAGLDAYAATVVDAVRGRDDLVLVAQSMAAFTAPIVATRVPTDMIVLVAPMTPAPGETPGEWWANVGQPGAARELAISEGRDPDAEFDPLEIFLHDVPEDVAAASAAHVRDQSDTPFGNRWPLDAWPDVPTRFILGTRDRLFPASLQRRLARERVGVDAEEIDSGHLPALSRPRDLATLLLRDAPPV